MRSLRVVWNEIALRGARRLDGWPRRLAGALLLALLCLGAGVGQARAAAPALGGSLFFQQPDYRGLIGGPPGARVTVAGVSWRPYSTVTLRVTASRSSCDGVTVGSFSTDRAGEFNAGFLWPEQANHVGAYYACGTQANYGSAFSTNAFSVLADSPPTLTFSPGSVVAGENVTITGKNWVPGPQTVNLVIVPCNMVCDAAPVASASIVTAASGTFRQDVTISASASTGSYYVQAANSTATLSAAPTSPLQVTGQASSSGTPVPGVSPTTTATRTTQGSTSPSTANTTPTSPASAALKVALVAAGLGLVALLALIGGLAFFTGRSRGPDLPPSRVTRDLPLPEAQPGTNRRATWRTATPAAAALRAQSGALALSQRQEDGETLPGEETLPASDADAPTSAGATDEYPWEEQIPPPPPEPEPPDQSQRSASGRLPPVRAPSDASADFLPPRRSQRPRPSEGQWES